MCALTPLPIADLILHLRRLSRQRLPVGVSLVHLAASAYIMGSAARYHYFRNSIVELAQGRAERLVEFMPGRLCLIGDSAELPALLRQLFEVEAEIRSDHQPPEAMLDSYRLPDDYMALRERLELLLQPVAAAAATGAADGNDCRLAGPLTPAILALIEERLDGVDLAPYIRRQSVQARDAAWRPVYSERFTGLEDLRAAYFPAVEIVPEEPLFFELCRHLDRLMLLTLLAEQPWRQGRIGINVGRGVWSTDEYRRLLTHLDERARGRLTLEIHWLDALADRARGGHVLAAMREAGFAVAIDRIGIETLPLLNLDRLEADWLKLVFDKARLALLLKPDHLAALRRCRSDRLILVNTDDRLALDLGAELGIRHYQGWLVDRLAQAEAGAPLAATDRDL